MPSPSHVRSDGAVSIQPGASSRNWDRGLECASHEPARLRGVGLLQRGRTACRWHKLRFSSQTVGTANAVDLRVQDSATKTGLLITPANTPYVGGTAPILSAGVVVVAGDFQCGDNVDSDGDGDDQRRLRGRPAPPPRSVCDEAACADADGQRPWDNCDDDVDGAINDGCAQSAPPRSRRHPGPPQ